MAAEGQLAARPQDEREPLIHMMEDRNKKKEKRYLSQAMTRLGEERSQSFVGGGHSCAQTSSERDD